VIANLRDDEQHQHKRGLGWVANTARVDDSVYVGPFAIVYGKANLSGRVRVEDFAQVSGTTVLSGDVIVCRNAWLDKGTHKTGVFARNERIVSKAERLRPAEDGL
jgi:acyl-[acyl carrier protein]--UDP-N-acetylglucosamine O-acyltransferase